MHNTLYNFDMHRKVEFNPYAKSDWPHNPDRQIDVKHIVDEMIERDISFDELVAELIRRTK